MQIIDHILQRHGVVAAVINRDDDCGGAGAKDAAAAVFGVEIAGEPSATVGEDDEWAGLGLEGIARGIDADCGTI